MLEDLSATAKQIDQWFSKLVSLIPQKIYAPLNNASINSSDKVVESSKSVKSIKRKGQREKQKEKTNKKNKEKQNQNTSFGPKSSSKEIQTSNAADAIPEENSPGSDIILDSKLQKVLAKTRGEKLKDDPKVLKRRLKEKERRKRKSNREWLQRKKTQEEKQKIRQQRREQNIQKRKKKRKTKKSR